MGREAKDGVELFVDNRQIFLIFFASAVVLSLVFALGVVVGKRAERRAAPLATTDPLALIDQMGGDVESEMDNLTFHDELSRRKNGTQAESAAGPALRGPRKQVAADTASSAKPAVASKADAPDVKPAAAPPTRTERALVPTAPKAGAISAAKATTSPPPAAKAPARKSEKPVAATEQRPTADPPGARYSLQVSAFQDRQEAAAFVDKLRAAGMQPHMQAARIPGRGVWYRVRIGSYASWDEAMAAKEKFEREQAIIAYVARK